MADQALLDLSCVDTRIVTEDMIVVLVDLLRDAEAVIGTIGDECSDDGGESLLILMSRIRDALDAHDSKVLQRAMKAGLA